MLDISSGFGQGDQDLTDKNIKNVTTFISNVIVIQLFSLVRVGELAHGSILDLMYQVIATDRYNLLNTINSLDFEYGDIARSYS